MRRALPLIALCIGGLLLSGCSTLSSDRSDNVRAHMAEPLLMHLQIGGFTGGSVRVTYDEERGLRYTGGEQMRFKASSVETVAPTGEEWQTFLDSLNEIGVWNWRPDYIEPTMADGTQWRVVIVYAYGSENHVVSHGSNKYPPKFDAFLAAVQKLVGDRPFG